MNEQTQHSARRIIIAGGGTGGHIFPAVAIANALKRMDPDVDILFVGAKGKMEMEKVPHAGYKIEGLTIAGYNRSSLIKNIGLPFKLAKKFFAGPFHPATIQARRCIGCWRLFKFPGVETGANERHPNLHTRV